jgi:hypothetical protein
MGAVEFLGSAPNAECRTEIVSLCELTTVNGWGLFLMLSVATQSRINWVAIWVAIDHSSFPYIVNSL